jgi:hypothetical protein
MKRIIKISILSAMVSIAMMGCKKENSLGENMQAITLKGIVKDVNGNPLSSVNVVTGSVSAVTSSDGTFSFSKAEVINSRTVIRFEKNGYFTLTRSGVRESEMFIEAVLTPKGNSSISLQTSFNVSDAKDLEIGDMKVALSASSIVRADGSPYSGTVNADMLYLDPNNENFATMMPGGDLAAITSDNTDVMLISWGMTDVNLTDNAGNPLQLKPGAPAEMTFPIPAGMETNPPATIPLWHFNETRGVWEETGVATLFGDVYVGTVTHFSWVNLDEPARRVTIRGKVVDCENKPVPYVQVRGWQTAGTTNSKGEYSVTVPEQTPVTLSVTANGGSDSQFVPGQPGNTTFTAANLRVPCPDDDNPGGDPGTATHTEKGSVKYQLDGLIIVFTFDNNGKRFRYDMFSEIEDPSNQITYVINHINKTLWWGFAGQWMDMPYDYDSDPGEGFPFSVNEAELAPYQQPNNITIAGKSCKVYKITGGGTEIIIASWNGLMMLYEVNGDVIYMATAATLDVPAAAFTKTFTITWLP